MKRDVLKLLEESKVIESFEILDFRQFDSGFYLKLAIKFIHNTYLYASEYFDVSERNYSFHWQDQNGEMILRWDNAPHHPNIHTYPHHKHKTSEVFPSLEITLEEVIAFIENELTNQ
ncbi:MAG: DUF6516 family protein [Bacteroidales bacterium]|nr:DUF6516 family protein [Bacteroidales bacterium]